MGLRIVQQRQPVRHVDQQIEIEPIDIRLLRATHLDPIVYDRGTLVFGVGPLVPSASVVSLRSGVIGNPSAWHARQCCSYRTGFISPIDISPRTPAA